MSYPTKRDLDGVYFRVCRDGKWDSICFSDLTKVERDIMMTDRGEEWLRNLCNILADTIYDIGEQLNIVGK